MLKEIHKGIISLLYFKKKYDKDLPSTGVPNKRTAQQYHTCTCGQNAVHILCVILVVSNFNRGFPGGSDSKESACNAGDVGSVPGSGRAPGERKGSPLLYSCLEHSMNRRSWWLQSTGSQRVRRTEWLTLSLFNYNRAFCSDRNRASDLKLPTTTLVAQMVKLLPATQEAWLDPWAGRSPGEGNGHPLQYPCLENAMDRGVWQATVHGVAKELGHDWVMNTRGISCQFRCIFGNRKLVLWRL